MIYSGQSVISCTLNVHGHPFTRMRDQPYYKLARRKYNDRPWLFAYVLIVICLLSIAACNADYVSALRKMDASGMLIGCFACVWCIVYAIGYVCMSAMYFERMFSVTCIYVPVALVVYLVLQFFLSRMAIDDIIDCAGIVSMFYAFCYICLRIYVPVIAGVMRELARALFRQEIVIFSAYIALFDVWFGLLSLCMFRNSEDVGILMLFAYILLMFFSFFFLFHTLVVFTMSVITIDYFFPGIPYAVKIGDALKNTVFSTGTICLGTFIDLMFPLLYVASLVISLLPARAQSHFMVWICDLAKYSNGWTLWHVALAGNDYRMSMEESWRISEEYHNYSLLSATTYILILLFATSASLSVVYYSIITYFAANQNEPENTMRPHIRLFIVSGTFFSCGISLVVYIMIKSVFYIYSVHSADMKSRDRGLYDSIESFKRFVLSI